jgi:hypothetical protein
VPSELTSSLSARQAQPAQQARRQQDHLGIDVRTLEAERLGIDLMKLAVAPRLRPLAPEHRAHAPDAQPVLAQQPFEITARTMPAVASGRSVM